MSRGLDVRLTVLAAAAAAVAGCATVPTEPEDGGRTVETVCEFSREAEPEGLSGITRIGGNRYYSVDDRGGFLHELEIVQDENGEIESCTVKRSVRLQGRTDLEGCAYDPFDGRVWVSDEHDTTICAFDPETGKEVARAAVPEVYRKNVVANRSFEGLTISPDGYRMYVANEDTLKCDGRVADDLRGGVVRIQEFVRTGKGAKWVPTRQFRYRTDRVEGSRFSGLAISGVAGLCAPGDGTLLVLEREMSQKNPLFPSFRGRLYEIGLDTDALEPPKRLLWDEDTMFANYEGICLGPKLKSGVQTLILVSDGGGEAEEKVLVLSSSAPASALSSAPASTVPNGDRMSRAGDCRLPEKAFVVSDTPGYNSWPMIQAMGTSLVCSYSRDNARPADGHTIDPGSRDSYVRVSSDGGRTWSSERTVADDPKIGEVNEGIGLDSTGAALLWVRCWGKGRRHELYRTVDGVKMEKITSLTPDPFPMQVMDPVAVAGLGLVSPWFAGSYRKDGSNSWGILVSADDGRTWTQRVIEDGLSVKEWVTEPSLVDLGGGRLLIVGRCEQNLGSQFQVTSTDNGKTWKKARTNISDVRESTPSLVYDRETGLIANYYYHRGARQLKRRVVAADFIFDRPDAWPEPEVLDRGFETRPHDAGNVKATRLGDTDCCAWYSGTPSNSTVVVTVVSKP